MKPPRSSPLYTGHENERYIEAINDERFVVAVRLDPAFDFKKYTQARAYLDIDEGSPNCDDITQARDRSKHST